MNKKEIFRVSVEYVFDKIDEKTGNFITKTVVGFAYKVENSNKWRIKTVHGILEYVDNLVTVIVDAIVTNSIFMCKPIYISPSW